MSIRTSILKPDEDSPGILTRNPESIARAKRLGWIVRMDFTEKKKAKAQFLKKKTRKVWERRQAKLERQRAEKTKGQNHEESQDHQKKKAGS